MRQIGKDSARRLDFVDALRGVAALYVIIHHIVLVPRPKLAVPKLLEPIVFNGNTGVTLFFLLSAFTLYYTLDARQSEPNRTTHFYIRRIFRIAPLYYCWIAVMTIDQHGWNPRGWFWKHLLLWLSFGFNFIPGDQEGLVMASWTLGVEMLVYLVFPAIFRFVDTGKKAVVFLAFTVVVAVADRWLCNHLISEQWRDKWLNRTVFTQLPIFAMGIIAFFVYRTLTRNERLARRISPLLLGLALLGIIVVPILIPPFGPHAPIQIYPMSVVYLLAILGLGFSSMTLLVNRVTLFLGNISYSLYLNHLMAVFLLERTYGRIYRSSGPVGLHLFECVALTLVIVVPISWLTYRFIEQPGIRAGSRLIRRFQFSPPSP